MRRTRPKIPNARSRDETRYLSPDEVASLRSQQAIISIQRHILQALEKEFTRTIEEGHRVDLSKEVWELDLDKGELRRGPNAQ